MEAQARSLANKIRPGSRAYYQALIALFLGSIIDFGTEYCVQPIIPIMAKTFGLAPATASLSVSAGLFGMSLSMIGIAILARRLGRRTGMMVALVGGSLMALIIALCGNFEMVLALRFVQGVLLAAFPAMAIAYINEEFTPSVVGTVVGIYVSGTAIGGLAGRLILSAMTDHFSWRISLFILGAIYLSLTIVCALLLPKAHSLRDKTIQWSSTMEGFKKILKSPRLIALYVLISMVMGSFVCAYNFISYVLMAPPYSLSQTLIGTIFLLYLVGSVASTLMGMLADRIGAGPVLCLSIVIMCTGNIMSLGTALVWKIVALGVFTYGFFGTHSSACGWACRLAPVDKAQISALYMFTYYMGASIFGSWGGVFLTHYGWMGVVTFITCLLVLAFILGLYLLFSEKMSIMNKNEV